MKVRPLEVLIVIALIAASMAFVVDRLYVPSKLGGPVVTITATIIITRAVYIWFGGHRAFRVFIAILFRTELMLHVLPMYIIGWICYIACILVKSLWSHTRCGTIIIVLSVLVGLNLIYSLYLDGDFDTY
jgi:hypothetical protein